ncbi:MAG TPA: hypothetical protein VLC06_21755 [Polyangia bacterium]|nr:hypothetical protein [Polyangia bacterium]
MPTQKQTLLNCRTGAPAALAFAFVFGFAVVEAGCSSSSSTGDGSAEGGSGGAGGLTTGGASGQSGHPGTGAGGTAGGTGGVSPPGTGGIGGTYACGSDTCTVGESFCYTYTPGSTGGHPGQSCQPLPTDCVSPTSCACVSGGVGCSPEGMSCSDTGGAVYLNCSGI